MKKEKLVKITLQFILKDGEFSQEVIDQLEHVLNSYKHKVLNFRLTDIPDEEANKLREEID